jgi:hypothetical protein
MKWNYLFFLSRRERGPWKIMICAICLLPGLFNSKLSMCGVCLGRFTGTVQDVGVNESNLR